LGGCLWKKQMAHKKEQIAEFFASPFCLSFFFLVSVLFMFKLAIIKPKSKANLNQLPSPPKLPIIGNLHQLGTLPHRSLRDLSLKYGNMMLLQLGQRQTLVISSADVVMEIMKTHDLAFSNRPQNIASKILLYGCKDVVFGHYGENWRQKRKISVVELLSMKCVQSFGQNRKEEVEELVNKIREVSSNDACVNLSEMLNSTINNIVCKCAIGKKYEDNNVKELSRKILFHISEFVVGDYFPLLGWVDILSRKIGKSKETFQELNDLFDKVIEECLAVKKIENEEFKKKGFVDILLQLRENSMLEFELSNNDIKAIITVYLLLLIFYNFFWSSSLVTINFTFKMDK
jgi:cytochrome P450